MKIYLLHFLLIFSLCQSTTAQTFAVIGDFGLNSPSNSAVARLVKSWSPEFIITVGDNNYPNGDASTIDVNVGKNYSEFIYPYKGTYGAGCSINRFFPTLGNHDIIEKEGEAHFDYFELPNNERYYDFIKGDVHFFAINSNTEEIDGTADTSVQALWLKEKLSTSESKWNVVYFHHPPYTSGPHGDCKWMQWPFKEWGASVVIAGHDHLYERLDVDDLTYLINGAGGASIYPIDDLNPHSILRYEGAFGALKGTVTEDGLTFEFINTKNETIDRFTLVHKELQKH